MRTMTRFAPPVLAAGLLFASATGAASNPSADELKDKFEEKLAQPFVKNGGWIADFEEAQEAAQAQDRVIFAYFTRSYAP